MNVGIVVHSNDPETDWSAFRFPNRALTHGDSVGVPQLGKGVEAESLDTDWSRFLIVRWSASSASRLPCGA